MKQEEMNTQLYEKLAAEQTKYRDWLMGQPPEEILNHAYEYAVREDILAAAELMDIPHAQAAARAAELRHELDYHAYRYYMLDAPEITDAAFDKMLVELQEIEATYPDLVTPDSYTQRVGGYVSEQFTPVTHMARMYSMDDAMDLDELDAWLQRAEDALGAGSVTYTCELKIDGPEHIVFAT